MTDARTTQIALEQWGDGKPIAQTTQIAIEQWASVAAGSSAAVLTQIAIEQWALGKLDRSITADPGAVTVSGIDVTFKIAYGYILSADVAAIVISSIDVTFRTAYAYVFPVDVAAIVISGIDAGLIILTPLHITMQALSAEIVVDGKVASLVTGNTMPPPGVMNFGIPRVTIPKRW